MMISVSSKFVAAVWIVVCALIAVKAMYVFVFIIVSQPLTKALENTSKTFQDIGKLYTEEVSQNNYFKKFFYIIYPFVCLYNYEHIYSQEAEYIKILKVRMKYNNNNNSNNMIHVKIKPKQ